jgi:hypothetical protein
MQWFRDSFCDRRAQHLNRVLSPRKRERDRALIARLIAVSFSGAPRLQMQEEIRTKLLRLLDFGQECS